MIWVKIVGRRRRPPMAPAGGRHLLISFRTYLARALQRGRAGSCEPAEPCACHSGTGEGTMFYARRTLPNLTTCIHSPYSYILCVSEAKMAARWPPTPSPRVTATGVDSAPGSDRTRTDRD